MANEKAILEDIKKYNDESFNFDDLEERLQSQLDLELSELEFLQTEKEKIGNPDNLGETIKDVIWEQFINQIGINAGEDFIKENNNLKLDLRNDAHIQTAENFDKGKLAKHNYKSIERLEQNHERYKNKSHKTFRKEHVDPGMNATLKRAGNLKKKGTDTVKDIYTGRQISTQTKLENGKNDPKAAQREHVKPSSELYKNPSLQMANSDKELAGIINDPENLQGYTTAERNNRKSDKSADDMSELDKNKSWQKADKKADEHIKQKEEEGESRLKKEGRETQKEEAFRVTSKALRAVVMSLLAELVKEIIANLVKWFKSAKKSLDSLLSNIKSAISSFVANMKTHLISAGNTLFTTILTTIIGPIVGMIKKVFILLKQGWKSLKEAINYIKKPENKGKPIGRLILEVGKIVMTGLSAASAIVLSEVIEKGLMTIPILAIEIPLIGSLANILGIFMGALVSGIIGAIAINLIEKAIEKQVKTGVVIEQIDKGNEILYVQNNIRHLNEEKLEYTKNYAVNSIKKRHEDAANQMKQSMNQIFDDKEAQNNNQDEFDEMNSLLDQLLD